MANNTFVGFNLPGSPSPGTSATDSRVVRELQPVTTWSRDGNYNVTRRWRGPIDALKAFSEGGIGEADFDGTYFSGAVGILPGGAGIDGAVSTNLLRDDGGQLGLFTATWVTSNVTNALGDPKVATRTGTGGDQYQESSLWSLDGNDLEKDLFDCPVLVACKTALSSDGFPARAKKAVDNYKNGLDVNGAAIPDMKGYAFIWDSYLSAGEVTTLQAATSILGNGNLFIDLRDVSDDAFKGTSAFRISQYVLRNTKVVNYSSSQIPHYTNTNRVWTTAQIKTVMAAETRTIDPPTTVTAYTLPLIGVLGTILNSSKWLYGTPDVTQLNNGKWQITKEWTEGADIASSCYELAV
jgi:hypothetical protein